MDIPQDVLDLRGWTRAATERLGLSWDGERVVIPVHDATGDLLGNLRYHPDGGKPKMIAPAGMPRELFPPPEMIGDEEGNGWRWLVEGEPDCIAGWSIGLACVAVPGAQNWRKEWASRFWPAGGNRHVAVCFDDDEAGRAGARRAEADLLSRGVDARILDLGVLDVRA